MRSGSHCVSPSVVAGKDCAAKLFIDHFLFCICRAPIWTGQRGSNAGITEDTSGATKLQLQQPSGGDGPAYPNDEDCGGEDAGPVQLKKDEIGPEEMAQDGVEGAPEGAPNASYTESEERETKDECGDATEEAAVASKSEEAWAPEGAAPHDAPVE